MNPQQIPSNNIEDLLQELTKQGMLPEDYKKLSKQIKIAFQGSSPSPQSQPNVNNYRVLIVLGCDIKQVSLPNGITGFGNSFVFSVAFMYKHLFKYLYHFQDDQILITNIADDLFLVPLQQGLKKYKRSPTREGFYSKDSTDTTSNEDLTHPPCVYNNSDLKQFMRLNTCTAQVFNTDYLFPLLDPNSQIYPFNRQSLKMLNVNEETELFIFFLNHGTKYKFSLVSLCYDFFLERIIELNTKKNYIFIDCCHSGSFVKLLMISEKLQNFFPQIDQESDENYNIRLQALFKLLNKWKIFKSKELDDIFQEISLENKKIKEQITKDFETTKSKFSEQKFKQFVKEVSQIQHSTIVPQHFIQIKNNSLIFCSSESTAMSFGLPIRFYQLGFSLQVSSYGTYFSSIILKFFLNPSQILKDANDSISAQELLSFIDSQFKEIGTSYPQLLKYTNKQLPKPGQDYFKLFLSENYSSKKVYSFCNDIFLPSFLTAFPVIQNPPLLISQPTNLKTFLDFNIKFADDKKIISFLSKFIGEIPNNIKNISFPSLTVQESHPIKPKRYFLLFETIPEFLDLVEQYANKTLDKMHLKQISLAKHYPLNVKYFDLLDQVDDSTSELHYSLQDQIEPLFGYEIATYCYDSKATFLKMLDDLKKDLKNSLNGSDDVFEIIKDKYLPQIFQAVLKVVNKYYSHLRYGSKKL